MGKVADVGRKVGARKINCEEYLPKVGKWKEQNIIHDFGDGWLIVEDRTVEDVRTMATLTRTCVAAQTRYLYPARPEQEVLDEVIEKSRKAYDGRYYREYYEKMPGGFEKFMENTLKSVVSTAKQQHAWAGIVRLMHIQDPEGRPRCCIYLVHKELADKPGCPLSYAAGNDLGQEKGLMLDGIEWRLSEARIGTGTDAPAHCVERLKAWYKITTGKWDEKAFRAHKPKSWQAAGSASPAYEVAPEQFAKDKERHEAELEAAKKVAEAAGVYA